MAWKSKKMILLPIFAAIKLSLQGRMSINILTAIEKQELKGKFDVLNSKNNDLTISYVIVHT